MSQAEIITEQPERPRRRRTLQTVGAVALKHAPESARRTVEDIAIRRLIRSPGFETRLLTDEDDIRKALELEQAVWHEKKYGKLDDYEKYLPQSRIIAAFNSDDCIGMARLFAGTPEVPPYVTEMTITEPELAQQLIEDGKNQVAEEFGTVAVKKEYRRGRAALDIYRYAYRDATERGIQTWGIIMEPDIVEEKLNRYGFTFRQIGPVRENYQGGDCAPHIMDFDEVRAHMSATRPELYDWFVNQPL